MGEDRKIIVRAVLVNKIYVYLHSKAMPKT